VIEQISKGSQFAAPTESLNELSRTLTEVIPCAEKVIIKTPGQKPTW
jgi:hypothetical protein